MNKSGKRLNDWGFYLSRSQVGSSGVIQDERTLQLPPRTSPQCQAGIIVRSLLYKHTFSLTRANMVRPLRTLK